MASIQGVYVALFGRPADPTGLAYFDGVTSKGADLTKIGDLAATTEYLDRFKGMSNPQIINSIYQSLFGRDAEIAGLNFFANALLTGKLTINNIAIAVLDGAQGDDKTISDNKISAADLYTKALDTGSEVVAYSGTAAAAQGVAFLKGITTTLPTASAVDAAVATMVTASNTGGTGTAGQIYTLATGAVADVLSPTSSNSVTKTTDGNDTIRGLTAGDLSSADVIDGGKGTDTLNALMATNTTVSPVLTSVENVNLTYGTLTGAAGFDASGSTGIVKLAAINVNAAATGFGYSVTGLANSATFALQNYNATAAASVTVGFKDTAGTSDSASVSLEKTTAFLTLDTTGIETLTLKSGGAAATDINTAILKDAALTKLVITGSNDLTLTNDSVTVAAKTVDASAFTGKLTYTAAAGGETIYGGAKADAITLAGGNDVLVYTAANKSSGANMDAITTFAAGTASTAVDKIDLKAFSLEKTATSAVGIAAAGFNTANDSSGVFTADNRILKLQVAVGGGSDTYLLIDTNKSGDFDAGTDMLIKLVGIGAGNIDISDFILA